jgi:hypothetical protein
MGLAFESWVQQHGGVSSGPSSCRRYARAYTQVNRGLELYISYKEHIQASVVHNARKADEHRASTVVVGQGESTFESSHEMAPPSIKKGKINLTSCEVWSRICLIHKTLFNKERGRK